MLHLINWEAVRTKRARFLMLDLTMLVLATVHLLLLGFDTTYFHLRTFYLHHLPSLVALYDPIKGVSPHRETVNYRRQAEAFFATCRRDGTVSAATIQNMIASSLEMIETDPFARASLSGQLELIKLRMREYTHLPDSSNQAFRAFWLQGCQQLEARSRFFADQIVPHLELNYWRALNTNGEYVDGFVYIDLGFVSIFLLEFLISWLLAIRRLGREQRVLYPIYHWYDLISCLPFQQLRFLRLLRILAVYYRLIRSDVIQIHNSKLYRSVLKYQRIVVEEISDRVAVQILTNIQAKTRLGGSRTLVEDTLHANRDEIRDVVVANLLRLELPSLDREQHQLVELLTTLVMQSIRATDEFQRLDALPLVSSVVNSLVSQERISHASEQAIDAFQAAWARQLQTPEIHALLCRIVDDLLDQAEKLALDQRIQLLMEQIGLKVLEELKEASTTSKIWKQPQDELVFERVEKREAWHRKMGDD